MKSRPAASCVGGPAWSKAQGSESCPVGVRRFKSCPTHLVETGRGHCHPAPFLDIDTRSGPSRATRGGMKIVSTLEWSLLGAATIFNGILAGGSLLKSVVELPARRTIGLPAMAAYHRAADLRTGLWIYPALGLGAPALTIALGIAFVVDRGAPVAAALFGYLAAALSLAPVFATIRAAPNLLKLRSGIPEEVVLADVYRAFTRWQTVRAILH